MDFTEKVGWEEATAVIKNIKLLKAHRSRGQLPKAIIQEPPFWKGSFLCRMVHLSFINVQMHFK